LSVAAVSAAAVLAPAVLCRNGAAGLVVTILTGTLAALLVQAAGAAAAGRAACRRVQRRYDLLVENIDAGVMVVRAGRVVAASRRLLALLGAAQDEVIGRPFAQFAVRAGGGSGQEELACAGAFGGVQAVLTRARGVVPVEVVALPLEREERGSCLCIVREMTERRRIEQERARFMLFVEKNPNPMVEAAADGRVLYANEAALGLFPLMPQQGAACPFLAELPSLAARAAETGADGYCRELAVGAKWYLAQMYRVPKTGTVRVYGFDVTDRKRAERSLVESEEKYRLLFETVDQGIMYHGPDGKVMAANPAAERILGMSLGRMIYKDCAAVFAGCCDENGEVLAAGDHPAFVALARGAGTGDRVLGILHGASGERRWISIGAVLQARPGEPSPAPVYTIFKDITDQRRADREARDAAARYRSLFESSRDGILIADGRSGEIIDLNLSLSVLTGRAPEELRGMKLWETPAFKNITADRAAFIEMQLKGYARYERVALPTREGGAVEVEVLATACSAADRRLVQCSIRPVSRRSRAEDQIRYLSFHDKVTGLYNRTYFEEELRRIDNERWMPISFIMGDVNNLKLVNDAFGHREGDRLLVRIAGVLRSCCRTDDIIARWGGDEFVVLLPRTDEKTVTEIARRIREECGRSRGCPAGAAIALGTATKERGDQDVHDLLREAEDRMYRNKLLESRSGRNVLIASLIKTLRRQSHETLQHTQRVRRLCIELGRAAGLSDSQMDELTLMAALHDIGKIAVPAEILLKTGMLTPKEWKTVAKHPEVGYRIVQSFNALARIADAVLAHHERWDGSGYPQGLKGGEIPLIARIFAIADAYDVMTQGRPYEPPLPAEHAVREIRKQAGRQFDPVLAGLFIEKVEPLRLAPASGAPRTRPTPAAV
jgi:diguanylate cyclase (GGDEF)-like protein/PAS domain S-box-containing protein